MKRNWTPEQKIAHSKMAKEKGYGKWMKGKKDFWTIKVRQKLSESLKRFYKNKGYADHSKWESSQENYFNIHHWLIRKFGKAKQCDFCGSKNKVEWSKLKHKKYERKRNNFWHLCRSCHIRYDRHDNLKKYGIPNNNLR